MQSNEIKQWLKAKGRTQQWLAKELGVTFATVNRWCNDKGVIPASAQNLINMTFQIFDSRDEYLRAQKLAKEKSKEIKKLEKPFYDRTHGLMDLGVEMQEATSTAAQEQLPLASREQWAELNNANKKKDEAELKWLSTLSEKKEAIARQRQAELDAVMISDDDLYTAAAAINMHPQQLIQAILIQAAVKISKDISPE